MIRELKTYFEHIGLSREEAALFLMGLHAALETPMWAAAVLAEFKSGDPDYDKFAEEGMRDLMEAVPLEA